MLLLEILKSLGLVREPGPSYDHGVLELEYLQVTVAVVTVAARISHGHT